MEHSERLEAEVQKRIARDRAAGRVRSVPARSAEPVSFGEIAEQVRRRFGAKIDTDPAKMAEVWERQDREDAAERARERARILTSRLPSNYRECTFPRTEQGAQALRWLQGYRAGKRTSLVILGDKGTGKTWLAAALAREMLLGDPAPEPGRLAKGSPAIPVGWSTVEEFLQGTRPSGHALTEGDMITMSSVPVLFLDDLGSENRTPWAVSQLFRLTHERESNSRPFVVTSNLTGPEIHRDYEARTVDRMFGGATLITMTGESRRAPTPFAR